MNFAIVGTPGCGKTTLAKNLANELGLKIMNEKDFALLNKIGAFNEENELEIPIKKFEKKANNFLKNNKGIIFEGHTICEMKLNIDRIILIKIDPEILEERLRKRNYSELKIMDNVFCEGIEFCKKQVKKNYSTKKIIEIYSMPSSKQTFHKAIKLLNSKQQ